MKFEKFAKETTIQAKIIDDQPEYAWIEAELVDENGVRCMTSQKQIQFDSTGDGYLVVNMGTSYASQKVQAYNGRALIKLMKKGKEIFISIASDNLETIIVHVN